MSVYQPLSLYLFVSSPSTSLCYIVIHINENSEGVIKGRLPLQSIQLCVAAATPVSADDQNRKG
uniref:Uncharacterized protein n=1 Tax=Octopus bimaculoides TaxID=37653 RepID=A0A0L8HH54_OCTBM